MRELAGEWERGRNGLQRGRQLDRSLWSLACGLKRLAKAEKLLLPGQAENVQLTFILAVWRWAERKRERERAPTAATTAEDTFRKLLRPFTTQLATLSTHSLTTAAARSFKGKALKTKKINEIYVMVMRVRVGATVLSPLPTVIATFSCR